MRLLLILSTLSLASCEFLTFHSNQSAAWYVESGVELEFYFRTRTADRVLLQLISDNVRWTVRILYNGMSVGNNQSNDTRLIPADLLEDKWILFSAKLTNRSLVFSLPDASPVTFQHSSRFNWLLGGEVSSFAGCVRNVRLEGHKVAPKTVKNVSLGDRCVRMCAVHSCENGRCLERYESAECDCGTRFTGKRCEIDLRRGVSLKLSFTNQSDASAVLAPWLPHPSGRLRLQFMTLYPSSTIITLTSPQLIVSCSVNNEGLLTAETRNRSRSDQLIHQLILSDTHVTTNTWFTLTIQSVPSGLRIQLFTNSFSQSAVLPAEQSADQLIQPVLGSETFLGCIKGMKVSNKSAVPLLLARPIRWHGVTIGDRCVNRCEGVNCGKGVCVNGWSGHYCDCSRTLKTGEQCNTDAAMVGLRGNKSADFLLNRMQRLHSISFLFQILKLDGILLSVHSTHSYLSSHHQGAILRQESADFQLISQYNRLKISAVIDGNNFSAFFPPLLATGHSVENWNYVTVQFQSQSLIKVMVNDDEATLTTASWEWNADDISVGESIIGCLSQLTINRAQVLTEGVGSVRSDECPTHRDISVHFHFSATRLHGLQARDITLLASNLILQMEFLISGVEGDRGLLFLSLPRHSTTLTARVSGHNVEVLTPVGHIQSLVIVTDNAWHKLELKLTTADNRTWLRVSVDGHSESAVFSDGDTNNPNILIGQLRIGDDNNTSLGGCVRNVALFGSNVSLISLLSESSNSNPSVDLCPASTPCDFSPCANGGRCETGTNTSATLCHCSRHYSGRFCTNATTLHLESQLLIAYLLPPLVVMTLIAVTAFVGICVTAKISRRGTGTYRTREETGISIIQGSHYALSDTFMPPPKPVIEWPV